MCGRAAVACVGWAAILATPATAARPLHLLYADQRTAFDLPHKWIVVGSQQSSDATSRNDARPLPGPAALHQQRDPLAPINDAAEPSYIASADAIQVMNWIVSSSDNGSMPYLVVDKVAGTVFAFDSGGRLVAATPALVGMKPGDESTPGVGDRELSNIPPDDRTTPAGRFVAKLGRAAGHRDVLWIDYTTAISLHPVIAVRNQHRFERLKSPTPDDNRITYGCINVPANFYTEVVRPLFKDMSGVVYILPETKPLNAVFLSMPPAEQSAAAPATNQ